MDLKKRKRQESDRDPRSNGVDTAKPTAIFQPIRGRDYTLSVALPGSIIANALTHDQKTALAGQIARALAVFCVDEVVIFDDGHEHQRSKGEHDHLARLDAESGYTAFADPNHFLYHLLSYLETPPHLRKSLFPHHPNLRTAGALPSLDMPHHLRSDEWCQYREGVTLHTEKKHGARNSPITFVNAGYRLPVEVIGDIAPKTRLTIKFSSNNAPATPDNLTAQAVSPNAPREEAGYYWGYTPRMAASLSCVFTECPFKDGYDFSIGTSERGETLKSFMSREVASAEVSIRKHILVVFGGVAGLEMAVKNDSTLIEKGVTKPKDLFDAWVNLVDGQGSRTIRTEEAVWIGLMGLRNFLTFE